MKKLLLDTNAYVAFKRGDGEVVELLRHVGEIVVPTVVLGELLAGFALGRREAANREELSAFLSAPRVRVAVMDEETANWYARVYSLLRKKGRPIPVNDLWIAATALQHGLLLLTYDEHFDAIEGLMTITSYRQLLP